MRSLPKLLEDWREQRRARHITFAQARQRALRGATYLDEIDPDWFWHVDPDTLELGNGNACVLGHLHGSFLTGLTRLNLVSFNSPARLNLSPVEMGFLCVRGVCEALQEQDYVYLNEAWQELIRQRQEAASVEMRQMIQSIILCHEPAPEHAAEHAQEHAPSAEA